MAKENNNYNNKILASGELLSCLYGEHFHVNIPFDPFSAFTSHETTVGAALSYTVSRLTKEHQ